MSAGSASLSKIHCTGGLLAKLEVLDASLRVAVVDLGPAVDTFVAADAEPLHPARLRLTANQVLLLGCQHQNVLSRCS